MICEPVRTLPPLFITPLWFWKNISRNKSAEKVGKMGTVALNYILPIELTFEETYFSYFLKFSFDDV